MLGFLYLILILGWMLIVIFLKCKKTVIPHVLGQYSHYNGNLDLRHSSVPSVHIIQLPSYDSSLNYSNQSNNNYSQSYPIDAIITSYSSDSTICPSYQHQEEIVLNAPPPTYEEVMRQPETYPKVNRKQNCEIEK